MTPSDSLGITITPAIRRLIRISVFKIAPESAQALSEILRAQALSFHIEDDDRFRTMGLRVEPATRKIRVGTTWLQSLWAHCLASWGMLQRVMEHGYGRNFDIEKDPFLKPLFYLVRASRDIENFRPESDILSSLPEKWRLEGRELFLCAIAWGVLHEIGHVHCAHGDENDVNAKREEMEADDFASNWCIPRWQTFDGDPNVFLKRAAGAVLALLYIATSEIYRRTRGGKTHPDPPLRLDNFIKKNLPPEPEDGIVRLIDLPIDFIICALKPHFDQVGLLVPENSYPSGETYVVELLCALMRHETS